ncbi:MAG: glycosyltransferase family 39 protein, partial [Planctomycetota bacterium]
MVKSKQVKPKSPPKNNAILISPVSKLIAKRWLMISIIAVLAAIPFMMGKYIEFNSPGAFDSGSYVYSAAHIINGAEIGVEEKPSAKLGTLLVNMLGVWLFGFSDVGPKIIQMMMQATALIMMFIAMKKLFGNLPAAVGVILAATFLSSPLFAKFGNVKEQYMISCMILGMSFFILYQLNSKWYWAILAGAFASWAPLFKETGISVIGAIGLFVLLQPIFKNRTFKQTGIDILLLFAGAIIALGPLYIWIIGWEVRLAVPYKFVWPTLKKWLPFKTATIDGVVSNGVERTKNVSGYVSRSREMIPFSVQAPRVMRHYMLALLPISLAVVSILLRILRIFHKKIKPTTFKTRKDDRFVMLLAVWWLLDMAFVWISPRSYEQYYLPLNASAAMLSGYLVAIYADKFHMASYKLKWLVLGAAGLAIMVAMSWHVFFGISKSPFSGGKYTSKKRGFIQRVNEISQRRKKNAFGYWEAVGFYIRNNSTPEDTMYVWGWYPGIYVKAQRFSPTTPAFMMPRKPPGR